MSDFASAAMLRVLHAGMRRMGLQSPAQQWLETATVPLDAKRQLVAHVLQERGIGALLQLGQGLHDVQHDSLMPLLIRPGQPLVALHAWLRLERYMHSKHRIEQTVLSQTAVAHRHISIKANSAPSPAEDWVVLGVLIALLQRAGCQHLEVTVANDLKIWPSNETPVSANDLQTVFTSAETHTWRITWKDVHASPALDTYQTVRSEPSGVLSMSERVALLAEQTLAEALSLEHAAQTLGHSKRSLQRKLNMEGTRYVDIIAHARAERASNMLSKREPSLAEIGFSCGYTDQAHFCRDFKRRVGMSPLKYREHSVLRGAQ